MTQPQGLLQSNGYHTNHGVSFAIFFLGIKELCSNS